MGTIINARPLGRSTRRISESAARSSRMCSRTWLQINKSKLPALNFSAVRSCCSALASSSYRSTPTYSIPGCCKITLWRQVSGATWRTFRTRRRVLNVLLRYSQRNRCRSKEPHPGQRAFGRPFNPKDWNRRYQRAQIGQWNRVPDGSALFLFLLRSEAP